jgi:hypothetical protein
MGLVIVQGRRQEVSVRVSGNLTPVVVVQFELELSRLPGMHFITLTAPPPRWRTHVCL